MVDTCTVRSTGPPEKTKYPRAAAFSSSFRLLPSSQEHNAGANQRPSFWRRRGIAAARMDNGRGEGKFVEWSRTTHTSTPWPFAPKENFGRAHAIALFLDHHPTHPPIPQPSFLFKPEPIFVDTISKENSRFLGRPSFCVWATWEKSPQRGQVRGWERQ